MGFISRTISAIGKLAALGAMLAAFLLGMALVVYMSLSGSEITVPEIVGKDVVESEKELAALGLKIRKRADRASTERMNTVLEQLPKAGETVKTGQWISVVVSKAGVTSDEAPKSLIKDMEDDDTKKIEEMISDKPKRKSNSNSNTAKKKADTTRDTIANAAAETDADGTKTDKSADNPDKKESGDKKDPPNGPTMKPQSSPNPKAKPASGDQRPRISRPQRDN